MKNWKSLYIVLLLALVLQSCRDKDADYIDPRGTDYAGAQSCVQCHKTTYDAVSKTAHFKATAPAILENMMANFKNNHAFQYGKDAKIVMEKRGDSLYQVLYNKEKEIQAFPISVIFGNENAQTYAYWKNYNTYELPVSYYKSIHNWATSPGFTADNPYFDRKIERDCYACHSSNVASKMQTGDSQKVNFMSTDIADVINKHTIVYGIDCERCHGPAKKHVDHHLQFPKEKIAQYITKYSTLTHQQKFDACAICHSGVSGQKIRSRFEFKPGDQLSEFYRTSLSYNMDQSTDVHGNQAGLLSQSKCFTESKTMECMTCHKPHENSSENRTSYAKICISCHEVQKHKPIAGKSLENNCVECHMPMQNSMAIRFQTANKAPWSSYTLRTHKIGIYAEEKAK